MTDDHFLINRYKEFKAGYVAILGRPNAGKSTLMNTILGEKLSIVTPKAQTTRHKILGILNKPGVQIIFQDTPGLIKPSYRLHEIMMEQVHSALADADVILYLMDAVKLERDERFLKLIQQIPQPVLLILNKIDAIPAEQTSQLMQQLAEREFFDMVIPVSALKNVGTEKVVEEIIRRLPVNPPFYPEDYLTDLPEKFFVAEIIREKIFSLIKEEIPYSTHVEIEAFKEREQGKFFIQAAIYVERKSQKMVLIGKGGSMIKRIGQYARKDIEVFLDHPLFLELFVKVEPGWRKKDRRLKEMGYND